ncbi:MAG: hypothetical protein QOG34_2052 [Frankiaceae bacterium]|jgi:hypothetical protein|nr:hypothetical protein [Frankiaceae bacterium]
MPPFVETNVEVVPNEMIHYRITRGGSLRQHDGVLRFSSIGTGSVVDWLITFDGKAPGIGALVKAVLLRNMPRALKQLAATPLAQPL